MDIKLPIKLNVTKDVTLLEYKDSIKQNIKNLLSNTKGKRPFKEYLKIDYDLAYQKGISDITLNYIQTQITNLIENFENRVILESVTTDYYTSQKKLLITIKYQVKNIDTIDETMIVINF